MGLTKPQACAQADVHTTTISDPASITGIRGSWRQLWRNCPRATPFQSPDWLVPWWDIFMPGELRIVAVHREDELVGLAPFYREGARLLPIGISLSDYQDVLLLPEHAEAAAEAVADAIQSMDDIEFCEFDELAPDAAALQIAPQGWSESLATGSPCPVLDLPDELPKLRQVIPPSRLRHLGTARRRVARRGDSAILEGDVDNAVALFRELVRLHQLRWKADGQKGIFADPRVESFHIAALPGLIEQGIARVYALTIDEAVVGVYYGLRNRDCAYAYIGGYDPNYAFESPGSVLLGHAIEAAVREGLTLFDFLRGSEDYKYEWGARDRWNTRMSLRRRHQ
jgi:CelD/BcsL family acetyltransferase involved in cellulose biosynthesis